jgi:hypothetical protein
MDGVVCCYPPLLYLPFVLCWACCYQHVIYERHFCATQENAMKKVGWDSLPHEPFKKNYGWSIDTRDYCSRWNEYYFLQKNYKF